MPPIIVVHGGAGIMSDPCCDGKLQGMKAAVRAAYPILLRKPGVMGTSALDAVEAAVKVMELDENFNAGFGSCLNSEGNVEMEASIMDGSSLKAGCVTLLHDIQHPISVARHVMDDTKHNFLGGEGAQKFALEHGFQELQPGSLVTVNAKRAYDRHLKHRSSRVSFSSSEMSYHGTVGAVAIDADGNIAVATSTGGIIGKLPGRIGDTPLVGSGTYADNTVGGVSTTGHGESIMSYNLAQQIIAKIRYAHLSAQKATEEACREMTERLAGTGGAICIDVHGELGIHFTSPRMGWAYAKNNKLCYGIDAGERHVEHL